MLVCHPYVDSRTLSLLMKSFSVTLAYLPVTFSFDDERWYRIFRKHWLLFSTTQKCKHRVIITTDSHTLESRIRSFTDEALHISCHKDRLQKYTFKSLNYSLKRLVARWLFDKDIFLLHASALITPDEYAVLFTGPRGAGKSTIVRLLGNRMIISDDTVFLTMTETALYCYPTPFIEKHKYFNTPKKYPIRSVYILKKSHHMRISDLPTSLRLPKTLQMLFILYTQEPMLFDVILTKMLVLSHKLPFKILNFSNKTFSYFQIKTIFSSKGSVCSFNTAVAFERNV